MAYEVAFQMRAYAAAHFEWDEVLGVEWADAKALFQSEYRGGPDARYPITILAEARGFGESPEEEQERLGNAIASVLTLIALAGNAAVATPIAVAAYGTELSEPRPFIGYRTPQASEWFPPGVRKLHVDATLALLEAASRQPSNGPLRRAINGYSDALNHWTPETRLLAGEFLYISAETLSRHRYEEWKYDSVNKADLSALARLKGQKKKRAESKRRNGFLKEAFHGDEDALTALEKASNGFEHGYMAIGDVMGLLEPVLERCFGHVRRALINALGVDEFMTTKLLGGEYAEPRGLVPPLIVVKGELRRKDATKPAPELDVMAIELEWAPLESTPVKGKGGKVNVELSNDVKAVNLPENVMLSIDARGIRAAHLNIVNDDKHDIPG